ncbi:MAG: FMN-binding protein [Rubripirellula sp.]
MRVCLVIGLLLAIPSPAKRSTEDVTAAPKLDRIALPESIVGSTSSAPPITLESDADSNGTWRLRDSADNTVGFIARTLPVAKDVVGYRGPTESAIVLDPKLNVVAVSLLSSADTTEHVAAVQNDPDFLKQFQAWSWGGPPADVSVDAVSGATLTSLAMAEGVMKRLGGDRPSLVFGDALLQEEVADWFPEAVSLDETTGKVRDPDGNELGQVIRTGPLSDDLLGYQGPTELLLRMSKDGTIEAIRIRNSFDNEPYVDYVRTEAGFWAIFRDQTLAELANFDPAANGVEGVSGATMTSLTVADTLVAAAQASQQRALQTTTNKTSWHESIRWANTDIIAIATLLIAAIFSRLRWYHIRWARRLWLIWVVAVIGLWSGNLISMALIAGWSAEGVAWRLAPGLSAIAVVALLAPPLTKGNPYCNHLCPHGAVQQLIRPGAKSRRHVQLPHSVSRWLSRIPGLTLMVAYVALTLFPTIDLSSWEPFHAYLFRIAGWGSIVLAFISLGIATVIPMGYCRLGCPTGRLIDYLRRTAISDRITHSDYFAAALLIFALVAHQVS